MKIINVSTGEDTPFSTISFPGGELNVKLTNPHVAVERVLIHADLHSPKDTMELILVTDALRRAGVEDIGLSMPYIPYARQDRICNPGESMSLKVFCDLINSQNYFNVFVADPHSEVAVALLNRCIVEEQAGCIVEMIQYGAMELDPKEILLVSPDAGADKKTQNVAKYVGFKDIIHASKIRDTTNGKITGTEVYCGDLGNQDLLIVDDICDGGYTFIELAKVLRTKTTGEIYLYITHGIFSKGLGVFDGLIDKVFCYKSFTDVRPDNKNVVIYKTKGEF